MGFQILRSKSMITANQKRGDDCSSCATASRRCRTVVRSALIGFGVGAVSGAAYLLFGGGYNFNIPLLARIVFYPGFVVGHKLRWSGWGLEASKIVGVIAVGLAYGLFAALVRALWLAIIRLQRRADGRTGGAGAAQHGAENHQAGSE